jgi:hypothetical protein
MEIKVSDEAARIINVALQEYRNKLEREGHEQHGERSEELKEVIDLSIVFATQNPMYSELVSFA